MALVNTIDRYEFKRTMERIDRDYYSYEAIDEIIAYFDDFDNVEFDPIAICCDFTEETPEYIAETYSNLTEVYETINADGTVNKELLLAVIYRYTYAVPLDNGNILYIEF